MDLHLCGLHKEVIVDDVECQLSHTHFLLSELGDLAEVDVIFRSVDRIIGRLQPILDICKYLPPRLIIVRFIRGCLYPKLSPVYKDMLQ